MRGEASRGASRDIILNPPQRHEARALSREEMGNPIRVHGRSNHEQNADNVIERFEDRHYPRSETFARNTHDPPYNDPRPDDERSTLRRDREISPWSSDDDNDTMVSMTSQEEEMISAARASLLAEEPDEGLKIRRLQEWVRDYHGIISTMQTIYSSEARRSFGDRDYAMSIDVEDRIRDVMIDATRVDLCPRSMAETPPLLNGRQPSRRVEAEEERRTTFERRIRPPVAMFRAEHEASYQVRSHRDRQRLPDRSRGSGDDSSDTSRTAHYGGSRQPAR